MVGTYLQSSLIPQRTHTSPTAYVSINHCSRSLLQSRSSSSSTFIFFSHQSLTSSSSSELCFLQQKLQRNTTMAGPCHPKHPEEEEENQRHQQKRLCDFCGTSIAVLYCRADSAKLCFSCDREVHSTNPLFKKHTRSQLCDSCDSNPSSIHCFTDNTVLCQNCDWASHGHATVSSFHDRRPVEGFSGCPCAVELSSYLGFEYLGKKNKCCVSKTTTTTTTTTNNNNNNNNTFDDDEGYSDLLVWETPNIVSLDDLILSGDSGQSFQALGIPPLPKNRKTACGRYKEEMIHQLCDMLKAENRLELDDDFEEVEALLGFQPLVSEPTFDQGCAGFDYYEGSLIQWNGGCSEVANETLSGSHPDENNLLPPDKPNDAGVSGAHSNNIPEKPNEKHSQNPIRRESLPRLPKVAQRDLGNHNRDLSISRYKEKRKTRRYEKHIRYESRKVRAECRTRIRGRFSKVEH